jgi:GT2 family glycosyltransferase
MPMNKRTPTADSEFRAPLSLSSRHFTCHSSLPVVSVSVIVPSWRRPAELERCLRALAAQTTRPAQVIVGARAGDEETAQRVRAMEGSFPAALALATTYEPGVVAAMSAALDRCSGDVVALTDDDAEPHPDWLERLLVHFADPRVGGAGGRDRQPHERGERRVVGRVQWFGRVIGNHHLGVGPPRDVDVLKGANCAFRASLLRAVGFDRRLQGLDAQLHWELALCLPLRRAGWRLVYDPSAAVEHHVAPRAGDDQIHRGAFSAQAQFDALHNKTLALFEHLGPLRRAAYLGWGLLVGTRMEPGVLQAARLRGGTPHMVELLIATFQGRLAGRRTWRATRTTRRDHGAHIPRPPAA